MEGGCIRVVNSKIKEYVDEVCSYIKFKKAHKEIKLELLCHIEEKTEDLMFQGMSEGWELMQILSIGAVFIIIAQICTSILNGIGKTVMPIVVLGIGCIVKIIINITFIPVPGLNIKAAAYATLFSYLIVALLDIVLVVKYTKITLNIIELFIGPAICTIAMVFAVVVIYSNAYNLWYNNTLATLLTIVSGGTVYIIMLMITGTMGYKEIKKLFKNNI
jgi:stage V sporulation protein B